MTASLFVSGTSVGWVGDGAGADGPSDSALAHAVSRPVVDGLEASVCGLLVTAVAAHDWADPGTARRCQECTRIAG